MCIVWDNTWPNPFQCSQCWQYSCIYSLQYITTSLLPVEKAIQLIYPSLLVFSNPIWWYVGWLGDTYPQVEKAFIWVGFFFKKDPINSHVIVAWRMRSHHLLCSLIDVRAQSKDHTCQLSFYSFRAKLTKFPIQNRRPPVPSALYHTILNGA